MLSLPDFRQKQVVYIECLKNKKVRFANQNLVIEEKTINPKTKKEKWVIITQIPCGKIFAVFILGNFSFSSVLVDRFQKHGISLFFLNFNFRCYGSFGAQTEGNVLLRKKQYTLTNTQSLFIAKHIIYNKIKNHVFLLQEIRNKTDEEKRAIKQCDSIAESIKNASSQKELLGHEGSAAKIFFSAYFSDMKWHGRKPRTKFDIVNTLLDRGYTTLFNIVESLLKIYGFDVYCGVYHQFFYQRKSLVCDIIEPFRCIIDKALRKAHHLGQIHEKDFSIYGHQYVLEWKKSAPYSKIFLQAIMKNKEEIFLYTQQYYRNFITEKFSNLPFFIPK